MNNHNTPLLERILLWAVENHIDIAPDYSSYLTLIMALVPYGSVGLEWAHAFCAQSHLYSPRDLEYRFRQVSRTSRNRIGLGSIVYLAKKAGFQP